MIIGWKWDFLENVKKKSYYTNKKTVAKYTYVTVAKTETASKSTPKSNASKKLSNSDIMKRSKLFRDHPKKGPRSELLFDKLVEETDKKQKEEKAMTDFEKTLEQIDVDEEDAMTGNENEDIIVVETEEPKKRRVIPPIPGRKPINKRGNTTGRGS